LPAGRWSGARGARRRVLRRGVGGVPEPERRRAAARQRERGTGPGAQVPVVDPAADRPGRPLLGVRSLGVAAGLRRRLPRAARAEPCARAAVVAPALARARSCVVTAIVHPSVTTVVATRGRGELLRRAVRSIAAQDYAGSLETVVVYDQPETDEPPRIRPGLASCP